MAGTRKSVPLEEVPAFRPATDEVIKAWAYRLRTAAFKATAAAQKWEDRKAELKAYMEQNRGNYNTEQKRRDKYEGYWELNDAMSDWSWNEREQKRLADLIQTEYFLRQLLPKSLPQLLAESEASHG